MPSHSRVLNHRHLPLPLPLRPSRKRLSLPPSASLFYCATLQLLPSIIQQNRCSVPLPRNGVSTRAFDEDSFDIPILDDWSADESSPAYALSSSEGEDSDGEVFLAPVNDVDLPSVSASNNDALTMAAHRFATIGRGRKKHRIKLGIFITIGLIIVLTVLLLYVDWCAWKIVRLPLSPFYLTCPFLISAILVSFAGYVCVPIFRHFKVIHVVEQQWSVRHHLKKRTPTMGGLFFVPIGIIVAHVIVGSSSIEVSGAAGVTIAFAAIGLLSDILSLTKNHWRGLPALAEVVLEDICLIDVEDIGSTTTGPYTLDGLAGGTAALAFTGMSIAVLPICSELAIFGVSMAGSCVGFLLHNRYRASVFMGDTGSLALGGALSAMAACTGMFFPLFISSGIFIVESSSMIIQVCPMLKMLPYISSV
ncbi:Phospho-N-acetylmuramoyl-pentapeptide transferase, conserved site [Sesbania bispinosa]|nr:Phospho-N-acetylmuramoyl-pentapeptide transferase, conserved site [Sesbania bispinosa]